MVIATRDDEVFDRVEVQPPNICFVAHAENIELVHGNLGVLDGIYR